MKKLESAIPPELSKLYGIHPGGLKYITTVQNAVFGFERDGVERILRLTPEAHRPAALVASEIDWVNYLVAAGMPVAAPIAAGTGDFCVALNIDGTAYTAVAFEKAQGEIGSQDNWTPRIFREWGRMTGHIHKASRTYRPSGTRRPSWEALLPLSQASLPAERQAQDRLRQLVRDLEQLPRKAEAFGLIHSDLHFWNFSVGPKGLTLFDFDNSEYNWFIADLGTIIFEAATCFYQKLPRKKFIAEFIQEFTAGYREANDIDLPLELLPQFIKLREICIYLVLTRRWAGKELGGFQRDFYASLETSVLTGEPFF